MATYPVLEHGGSRASRWLRARRFRLAVLIALAETILIVADVLAWRWAVVIAAAVFAFYVLVGRRATNPAVAEVSWTAALSQTIPVLFPLVVALVATVAVIALFVAALVVAVLLVLDRR